MDTYIAVCHMASMLGSKFAFPPLQKRQPLSNMPELQLISMLVVAIKLYHPFDCFDRHPESLTEIGYLTINWDVWMKEYQTFNIRLRGNKPFEAGSEINLNEHDALAMSDEQMDGYLEWYEKTWLDLEEKERTSYSLPQELLDMFPTGRPNGPVGSVPQSKQSEEDAEHDVLIQNILSTQRALKTRGVVSEGKEGKEGKQTKRVRRIGSSYKRYRRVEDLPDHAKVFYEATAKMAGLSLPTLVLAVFKMERKLQNWREERSKQEAEKSATDESSDMMENAVTGDDESEDAAYADNNLVEIDHSMLQSDNG